MRLSPALLRHTAPHSHLLGVPNGYLTLPYDNNGVIRLVIIDPGGDGNWVDNKFTMRLVTTAERMTQFRPAPAPPATLSL